MSSCCRAPLKPLSRKSFRRTGALFLADLLGKRPLQRKGTPRLVRRNVQCPQPQQIGHDRHRRAGDSPLQRPYEAQQVPADDSRERKRTGQLNLYYDAVTAGVRAADSLLIFGPGEAKGELAKRLERHHFSGRIVGSETADKMTQRQIAAKVRQYFHAKSGRQKE